MLQWYCPCSEGGVSTLANMSPYSQSLSPMHSACINKHYTWDASSFRYIAYVSKFEGAGLWEHTGMWVRLCMSSYFFHFIVSIQS